VPPSIHATTGGTGPCWNFKIDEEDVPLHVCDLGPFIEMLSALLESDVQVENIARWRI
jgi:hypothetical protein